MGSRGSARPVALLLSGAPSCAMQCRIAQDVEEVHRFLRVHAVAASEAAHAQLVYAQCKQLVFKFNASPMTIDDATRVLEVLADGPWTPAQALELRTACANGARPGTCSTSQKCQTFHDPENYLTPSVCGRSCTQSPTLTRRSCIRMACC